MVLHLQRARAVMPRRAAAQLDRRGRNLQRLAQVGVKLGRGEADETCYENSRLNLRNVRDARAERKGLAQVLKLGLWSPRETTLNTLGLSPTPLEVLEVSVEPQEA